MYEKVKDRPATAVGRTRRTTEAHYYAVGCMHLAMTKEKHDGCISVPDRDEYSLMRAVFVLEVDDVRGGEVDVALLAMAVLVGVCGGERFGDLGLAGAVDGRMAVLGRRGRGYSSRGHCG